MKTQDLQGLAFALLRMAFACLWFGLALAQPADAENRALLIGVSEYVNLDKGFQLRGPQYDVQLMRDVLVAHDFDAGNIRILADQVPDAAGLPTRSQILRELAALAEKSGKGDFVYLHFSGHGSQQPARPERAALKPNGLNAIFLPRDVGKWDGSVGSIENALLDDEIGHAIEAIRARGAFVWAVFDNCHAGRIARTRGVDDIRDRKVDPVSTLGVPQGAMDAARASARGASATSRGGPATAARTGALGDAPATPGLAGAVFFYAAQPDEFAPEMPMHSGTGDTRPYGLFTYSIAEVIASNPDASYLQAGQRVLQLYAARNMRAPTPMFEGPSQDAALFGQKAGQSLRQWKIIERPAGVYTVAAGALHQVGEGAIFAVLPTAAARKDDVIGYLRANTVDPTRSTLVAVDYNGKPPLEKGKLSRDAVARIVDPALVLDLRVAVVDPIPAGPEYEQARKVLAKLHAGQDVNLRIQWVPSAEPADLRIDFADHRLWLLPSDGAWVREGPGRAPSITLDKEANLLETTLVDTLQRIAKSVNLLRIASATTGNFGAGAVETHFFVKRGGQNAAGAGKDGEEILPTQVPAFFAGDQLRLEVRNTGSSNVDVNVLGMDSAYGITLLYPGSGEANRIAPGERLRIPDDLSDPILIDEKTVGREGILVIASEAQPQSSAVVLGFLEQQRLPAERGESIRGVPSLEDLFLDAAFGGHRSRGFEVGPSLSRTSFGVYRWDTQPANGQPPAK